MIFSELLQPFRYVGMTRVSPFLIVIDIFISFWVSGWLSQQLLFRDFRRARVSPFLPFNMFTRHNCGIGIYPTQASPFLSSHTSLRKTQDDQFPALKVSWMLKKASLRKNSLINQEPRLERSSPCCTVSEYRFFYEMWSFDR